LECDPKITVYRIENFKKIIIDKANLEC
jgi:hydroxymethylglutaryl-CoA reductase